MTFNEFRIKLNKRIIYLEGEASRLERKYVKTGKLVDRLSAIEFRSQLEELRNVVSDFKTINDEILKNQKL